MGTRNTHHFVNAGDRSTSSTKECRYRSPVWGLGTTIQCCVFRVRTRRKVTTAAINTTITEIGIDTSNTTGRARDAKATVVGSTGSTCTANCDVTATATTDEPTEHVIASTSAPTVPPTAAVTATANANATTTTAAFTIMLSREVKQCRHAIRVTPHSNTAVVVYGRHDGRTVISHVFHDGVGRCAWHAKQCRDNVVVVVVALKHLW